MARHVLTRIERLERKHPGLQLEVNLMLDADKKQDEICAMLKERYGETVKQGAVSHYKMRRWLPSHDRIEERRERYEALRQAAGPQALDDATAARLFSLAEELKPDQLIALRKVELLARQISMKEKELELKKQQLEKAQKALEETTDEAKAKIDSGQPFTVDDINRIRQRVFGLPEAAGGHPA